MILKITFQINRIAKFGWFTEEGNAPSKGLLGYFQRMVNARDSMQIFNIFRSDFMNCFCIKHYRSKLTMYLDAVTTDCPNIRQKKLRIVNGCKDEIRWFLKNLDRVGCKCNKEMGGATPFPIPISRWFDASYSLYLVLFKLIT